jgi:hypothetical protein
MKAPGAARSGLRTGRELHLQTSGDVEGDIHLMHALVVDAQMMHATPTQYVTLWLLSTPVYVPLDCTTLLLADDSLHIANEAAYATDVSAPRRPSFPVIS